VIDDIRFADRSVISTLEITGPAVSAAFVLASLPVAEPLNVIVPMPVQSYVQTKFLELLPGIFTAAAGDTRGFTAPVPDMPMAGTTLTAVASPVFDIVSVTVSI
jgi:hypothetical protein